MKINPIHLLLVLLQFAILGILIVDKPSIPSNPLAIILLIDAIIVGIWAVVSMNLKTISALPDIREEASLTQKGPYKVIRHPMYTAVIEFALGLVVSDFSWLRLALMLLLTGVLLVKISLEEKMLVQKYESYLNYKLATKKLIPFLF